MEGVSVPVHIIDARCAGANHPNRRVGGGNRTGRTPSLETAQSPERAIQRIRNTVVRTEVVQSSYLDRALGVSVVLKLELLQTTGSFKFRGAMNRFLQLDSNELGAGVVAGSSGNHGIAVARAASILGSSAVVVMPHDSPSFKRKVLERSAARVVVYDRLQDNRDELCELISSREGRTIIPSSQHPAVIAGAGTIAIELSEQAHRLDALLVPIGGGGLAAGCALALSRVAPHVEVYGVEPTGADDTAMSLRQGRLMEVEMPSTIADGLRHRTPGALTFPLIASLVRDILIVSDNNIIEAMLLIKCTLGLFLEPSSACALAAIIRYPESFSGKRVGVILTGGNIGRDDFGRLTS